MPPVDHASPGRNLQWPAALPAHLQARPRRVPAGVRRMHCRLCHLLAGSGERRPCALQLQLQAASPSAPAAAAPAARPHGADAAQPQLPRLHRGCRAASLVQRLREGAPAGHGQPHLLGWACCPGLVRQHRVRAGEGASKGAAGGPLRAGGALVSSRAVGAGGAAWGRLCKPSDAALRLGARFYAAVPGAAARAPARAGGAGGLEGCKRGEHGVLWGTRGCGTVSLTTGAAVRKASPWQAQQLCFVRPRQACATM